MENAMTKLAVFSFGNHEIRTITDEHGEAWFVANDVCKALELVNPRDALATHVDSEDVGRHDTPYTWRVTKAEPRKRVRPLCLDLREPQGIRKKLQALGNF